MRTLGMLMTLVLAVVVSGIAVSLTKYHTRKQFQELQKLRTQRDELEIQTTNLRLELSAWANPARTEGQVREKLGMKYPTGTENRILVLPQR